MRLDITETIELPSGITAAMKENTITVKGPKGEVTRTNNDPLVKMEVKDNKITLSRKKATKRQKRIINTLYAHIQNSIQGVQEPFKYLLKICSGHFPMNVSISGEQFIVKNFLGEKSPRVLKLKKGVSVKIEGDQIIVEGPDKELAGQQASDIELLTSKSNRDLRIFQDGIYLTAKAGQKVSEL